MSARRDAELPAADGREEGRDVGPWDVDGGEVVEDFKDGAARAGGVVEKLVAKSWIGEF